MSTDQRDAAPEGFEDPATAPFLGEDERAEAAWLIARDADPAAPAPSPEILREHEELARLLAEPPPMTEDSDWQAKVLQRIAAGEAPVEPSAPEQEQTTDDPQPEGAATRPPAASLAQPATRPRRRRAALWAAAGAALAAAAVLIVVLAWPGAPTADDELQIAFRRDGAVRGDADEAAIGDTLVVSGRLLEAGDLRVFRADGTPVGRCPGGPGCKLGPDGARTLEVVLDRPTEYRLILVTGTTGDLPGGTLSEYRAAVHAGKGSIAKEQLIMVR